MRFNVHSSVVVGSMCMTVACATGVELRVDGHLAGPSTAGIGGLGDNTQGGEAQVTGNGGSSDEAGGTATGGSDSSLGGSASSIGGADPAVGGRGIGGSKATGGARAAGGVSATGGRTSTSTGGRARGGSNTAGASSANGGAKATGGANAIGGNGTAGSSRVTGGSRATGGSKAGGGVGAIGGSKATGGAVAAAGGSTPGSCSFSSTACDSTVCSTVPTWETTACSGLLTCLEANSSCITATDPLCATKGTYGNPICDDLYNIGTTASRTALSDYVKCVCGL